MCWRGFGGVMKPSACGFPRRAVAERSVRRRNKCCRAQVTLHDLFRPHHAGGSSPRRSLRILTLGLFVGFLMDAGFASDFVHAGGDSVPHRVPECCFGIRVHGSSIWHWHTPIHAAIRLPQSARGLAQSKTLRAVRELRANALRFGLRRPSAAFANAMVNFAPMLNPNSEAGVAATIRPASEFGLRSGHHPCPRKSPAGCRMGVPKFPACCLLGDNS